MKSIPINNYPKDFATAFLHGITFVTELRITAPSELDVLLKHAFFVEASRGEQVLKAGTRGDRYFFLLYGQLSVYAENSLEKTEVNRITAGQCFGALSIFCKTSRIASVSVSPDCNGALMLSLDLSALGSLDNFSVFSLQTKLAMYRGVVNNTRWQLELYKMDYPAHVLSQAASSIETFTGRSGTLDELMSLDRQVQQMTDMIMQWNTALSSEQGVAVVRATWL
jgi:hypothetical protein